ncbi:hypothetical protein NP493_26g03053 [Ridgeia piscesae]|uniref:Uncharacterized protein n=1 Tax=Ridgeia piscesae TaxID=27915 RepID=A0AAD9PD54_RIDPI|nr:hypothetical protein NP493_26g03053 [Ridgeia piscesae]
MKRKFDFISPFEFGVEHDGSERSEAIETCITRRDMLSAPGAAVAEFNVGVAATMRNLCEVMDVAQGQQLMASAGKTDARRLQQRNDR